MLQQLQDAGLMQQLPVLMLKAAEDLQDTLASRADGSTRLHVYLDKAADVLTVSYAVIRLHHELHAVRQAHAVLAPAACGTIAEAMKYLSVHLPALQQLSVHLPALQQHQRQQRGQQGQQMAQKILLRTGTAVVRAGLNYVSALGSSVSAFGGMPAALDAVPQLQQLLDSPDLVPFLVLHLAVASQGLQVQQPLQELRTAAAAEEAGSRRGRQMQRTRGSSSGSSHDNSSSTSADIDGEQPLALLQQLQAQKRLPPTTPCQQQLFDLLGVDSFTLAWASQRYLMPDSILYIQQLLRLCREIMFEQHQQQQEKAATQWQLHLLLPAMLLPCAARLCRPGAAAAAALGLSIADQARLCSNIAAASCTSLHTWQAHQLDTSTSSSSSTPDEPQLWYGELSSLSLLVLHEVLLVLQQQQAGPSPAATPAAAAAANAAGSVVTATADGVSTRSNVPATSSAWQQQGCQLHIQAMDAGCREDWMHAAENLIDVLLLLLVEQMGLAEQQDRNTTEQQQQQQQEASLPGSGEGGCCSVAAGRQQQQQQGQGGAPGRGVSSALPPALSMSAQLPFLCTTLERLVRLAAAAVSAEGYVSAYTYSTELALRHVGSGCSSADGGHIHTGVLTAAAHKAGLGQAAGRQFYSLLCSLVKLNYCFSRQSVLQEGVMQNPVHAACAAMHAMHLEGASKGETSAPTLDALPSVFVIGRCCLLWADVLSAQAEDGGLALQESNQLRLLCFLPEYLMLLRDAAEDWLHSRSAQLSSAGYSDPDTWLQLLLAAKAAAAAAQQAEGEAVDGQCAVLVQELRALGGASCLFAVPLFCNNPRCMSLHGETEVSLVSGRACVCSGCRVARYCGQECLRQHWKQHKPVCKALAAAAAATGAAPTAAAGDGADASDAL
jgi:hypothetical protein